ncbi:MAG: alpha-ketoglutarate-dependent dioxygenase AlkB [Myxococcota bacterium]
MVQPLSLFTEPPRLRALEPARTLLGPGSWVDRRRGWVAGADALFSELVEAHTWHASRRKMYDRVVDVPRLFASVPDDGPGHPLVHAMSVALAEHYGRDLSAVALAHYRDGRDSVAFHGDRLGRHRADSVVAIVSLGGPRRFLVRPRGGGRSQGWMLGSGDLLVMGGRMQADFEHGVPKMAHAEPRLAVMFRSAAVIPLPDESHGSGSP